MKYVFYLLLIGLFGYSVQSCKKDEGTPPVINFRTGPAYTSSDVTVAAGDTLLIGIHAEKAEDEDVLKHFNVSYTVDGGSSITIDDFNLTVDDEDDFDVDYSFTAPEAGHAYKVTFTVTNSDDRTNSVSLTLTSN